MSMTQITIRVMKAGKADPAGAGRETAIRGT